MVAIGGGPGGGAEVGFGEERSGAGELVCVDAAGAGFVSAGDESGAGIAGRGDDAVAGVLPIFLAYVARAVFRSQAAFARVLGFAGVLGVVGYKIAMESAVEAAGRRREILGELGRTEGPVVVK